MHHETTGRGGESPILTKQQCTPPRGSSEYHTPRHQHPCTRYKRFQEEHRGGGGVGWGERRGSISDRTTARQSVSSSTEETHGPVVVISASPHIGEDAERVGVVARAGGARGGDGVHVSLVPLEAALPGEGPGADVAEVDVPDSGVQHLVALHVGLVAEGLGAHVAAERASLLPGPPEELRHMRWR